MSEGTAPERIEIWFLNDARAGRKGMLARTWARRGPRPRIQRHHRYGYAYLFKAARSTDPRAVEHVCARANTDEMKRQRADIAVAVAPGHHGVVMLCGVRWHRSKTLGISTNLTLVRLLAHGPVLHPVEHVFRFLKANVLANRVFPTVEDVYANLAETWDKFASQPNRIASITTRTWARITAPSWPPRAVTACIGQDFWQRDACVVERFREHSHYPIRRRTLLAVPRRAPTVSDPQMRRAPIPRPPRSHQFYDFIMCRRRNARHGVSLQPLLHSSL